MNRSHVLALTVAAGVVVTTAVAAPAAGSDGSVARVAPARPAAGVALADVTAQATATPSPLDPAQWSDHRLAAQLVFACVDAAATSSQQSLAAAGVGGIALLGDDAPSDLRSRLASVRAAAPHGVAPMIASDEEGGEVQRLKNIIYPLPSAETMGTWSLTKITDTAYQYGVRMRHLGVVTDFAPVTDLGIPGYYIASLHRAFSRYPDHVARDVRAWVRGMRQAHVLSTVKHWPGHGQATNTHTGAATIPPLSVLEQRDMIPFNAMFARHIGMVMVGHLMSEGLTDPGWPATESPKALRYLRHKTGPQTLIITDSLSMAAATSAVHLTVKQAVVRALESGADVALTCSPNGVIHPVTEALAAGRIHRPNAVASARRFMDLKALEGLVHGYTQPLPSTLTRSVATSHVPVGGSDHVTGAVLGGYRTVLLQERFSTGWRTVRHDVAGLHGRYDLAIPTGTAGTHAFRVSAPHAFPYAAKTGASFPVTVGS